MLIPARSDDGNVHHLYEIRQISQVARMCMMELLGVKATMRDIRRLEPMALREWRNGAFEQYEKFSGTDTWAALHVQRYFDINATLAWLAAEWLNETGALRDGSEVRSVSDSLALVHLARKHPSVKFIAPEQPGALGRVLDATRHHLGVSNIRTVRSSVCGNRHQTVLAIDCLPYLISPLDDLIDAMHPGVQLVIESSQFTPARAGTWDAYSLLGGARRIKASRMRNAVNQYLASVERFIDGRLAFHTARTRVTHPNFWWRSI